MKKLTVKQHTRIHTALYIVAGVLAVLSYLTEVKGSPRPILWGAVAAVVLSIVWRIVFIKCPKCGDSLSATRSIPAQCPNCGHDLKTLPAEGESK